MRGAALASRETLGGALEGVHLDLAPVVLEPASAFTATAEWLMELWSANGVSDDAAKGGFGADPLGLLARTGSLPQGVDRAMADAAGLASMAAHRMPGVRSLTVDATVYAEAGASDALELAAMLCTVVAYLRAMAEAGVDADSAAGQIEVVLGTDTDFFTTVAKLRAARTTLSGVLEASGAHPGSAPPSIVARTLDRSLSRVDPWVNLLRVTAGAFAAALGGADAVVTSAFDSQLGQPSDLGRRMARNTQLLLAEESNVGRVIDPAGGSWYVESLTDSIARRAWELFGELESAGGMAAVLGDSSLARRIEVVRDERFSAVADRSAPLTGVSEFPNLGEDLPETAPRGAASPPEAAATDSATSCEALPGVRWAEPFERLRELPTACAPSPRVPVPGCSSQTSATSPPTPPAPAGEGTLRSGGHRRGHLGPWRIQRVLLTRGGRGGLRCRRRIAGVPVLLRRALRGGCSRRGPCVGCGGREAHLPGGPTG